MSVFNSILNGPAIVIGSPATASDGQYQTAISELQDREVQRHMADRILDGATSLPSSHFSLARVIFTQSDFTIFADSIEGLFKRLYIALLPEATLTVSSLPTYLIPKLVKANFEPFESSATNGLHFKRKGPAAPPIAPSSNGNSVSMPLPRRGKLSSADKAAKKALWAFSSPSTPTIDSDSLLTESDRARPIACDVPNGQAPRKRKKACKNCTCGLAELEVEERANEKIVLLNGTQGGGTMEVVSSEKQRLLAIAQTTSKATSSCGSCYLGDAFRCADCPYIGLPAFKPGEQVQIDLSMDDI